MRVLLAFPYNGNPEMAAVRSIFRCSRKHEVIQASRPHSALANNFNALWAYGLAAARNKEVDYFAMLHSDVSAPEDDWLDKMIAEMERGKYQLVSGIIPIKTGEGITSTAIGPLDDQWTQYRMSQDDVLHLPVTFEDADLKPWKRKHDHMDWVLLLNTGCWVADLHDQRWYEADKDGNLRFAFEQQDRIRFVDNALTVDFASEDWRFSRECHRAGMRIAATRCTPLLHHGQKAWSLKDGAACRG